jgi:chromate reductase, NAD(P)H dehydrogenase (quinone)
VLESELPVGMADGAFAEDGSLADPELTARMGDLLGDLCREIRAPVEQSA